MAFRYEKLLSIVSKLEMVSFFIPCCCRGGLKGECMGVKEQTKSLEPGLVPGSAYWAEADETCIDLQV
ncbi:hypothetical protein SLEP1_g49900 [Rubroshorea leprosula]|uniref:Uncharacterized protein n=1 Tax=Rubroshorea leprosula TaxID=152421 RepID=A0AAV5M0B5_9ROSI|nr:hypothetical protein SLEP1_g49900 [Rubroshorea leprosula]